MGQQKVDLDILPSAEKFLFDSRTFCVGVSMGKVGIIGVY